MYLPSVLIGYLEAGEGKGADERARGPPTCSLRVIYQALQGYVRVCKSRILRGCADRRVANVSNRGEAAV